MSSPLYSHESRRPSLAIAVSLQVIGGVVVGGMLAYVGASAGGFFFAGAATPFAGATGSILGMLAGYPIGLALGVARVGQIVRYPAPLRASLLGALLGTWAPLLALMLGLRGDPRIFWATIALLGALGSIIAHHRAGRAAGLAADE